MPGSTCGASHARSSSGGRLDPLRPNTFRWEDVPVARRGEQPRRGFIEEFKRDAAALVIDTAGPVGRAVRELGVCESSLIR